MTILSNAEFMDSTNAGSMSVEESLWSRIVCQIGSVFGRTWEYINEDMGLVEDEDGKHYLINDCEWM